ncbi:MAG: glycine cleavage system aminomethyltransferase GcvT [Deltaproteobacteria bacterium]|nr:glycine cleavage system aminomethyltransferase GcvT [Deltaproteobacteria bacterium]
MEQGAQKTPLHAWHLEQGAHMTVFGGWEMPLNYPSGILDEHLTTRRFGGLFDISHLGRFAIRGQDGLAFLQYVLTSNVAALEPGKAQYTILGNEEGGAVDDAYLFRLEEEEYLLVVNAANREKDWTWLEERRAAFPGTVLEDRTEEISMVALQGPRSEAILRKILKEPYRLPEPGRNHLRRVQMEGITGIISRTGYTGEPLGFEIFFPSHRALAVWERLLQSGSEEGIAPVGLGARDTLRLEAALPLYGHEYGLDPEGREIPIFAVPAAKFAVRFTDRKGDYIGKSALLAQAQEIKLRAEGKSHLLPATPRIRRQIFPLAVLSAGVARAGFPVQVEGSWAGYVTSGTVVPYWKFSGPQGRAEISQESGRRPIALAYLDAGLDEGQEVQVQSSTKNLHGRIVPGHLDNQFPPYARPLLWES